MRKLGQAGKPTGGYSGAAAEEDDEPPAAFDPDALLPRTDISSVISSKLIANLGSANWKERNAVLDEVEEIIKSAGGRIQPTVGDLMPALKVNARIPTVVLPHTQLDLRVASASIHALWLRPPCAKGIDSQQQLHFRKVLPDSQGQNCSLELVPFELQCQQQHLVQHKSP